VPSALKTGKWLLSIMVPVSFVVLLLQLTGILAFIAPFFEPVFALLGLPGEGAIVFATSAIMGIFSAIAVMETLGMAGRTVTILALMCLISHGLPIESVIQKKTGSSLWAIILVRLTASFVGAIALNWLLPADAHHATPLGLESALAPFSVRFLPELKTWSIGIVLLCGRIMVIITLLMVFQRILQEFGITTMLSRLLRYPLALMGIPQEAAFLWVVANTLGLTLGAGVLVEYVESGRLSRKHADMLNYHIAISHSVLEDASIFMAMGVSFWWVTIPRIILAAIAVWLKRLFDWVRESRHPVRIQYGDIQR
jgi:spore maturation protein SpmB